MNANATPLKASERLPQELFELILDFILEDDYSSHFPDEDIDDSLYDELNPCYFSVRELGFASLVCKFWARRLRQKLFQWIKLQSRDRFITFIQLAESAALDQGLQIAELVEILTVTQDPHSDPWFHLVTHLLPVAKLPNAKSNITLDFTSHLPPNNQTTSTDFRRLRSVFQDSTLR